MQRLELGKVPRRVGEVPAMMKALVVRKEREGEPISALRVEELPVPPVRPNEALVLVMAAGVNFNGVWACRGKPVSVFRMHPEEDFHVPGSDASGIVWQVGSEVRRFKPGDEVVIHCNQSCGECPECNGLDPLACSEQKIWGYETNWGSFAQFTRVQAQQLLPKPKRLGWLEAASYGLTFFTAYRMLVAQAGVSAGDVVLVWGASGGLGVFATQICRLVGASSIAMVSSTEKAGLAKANGAEWIIDRTQFDLRRRPGETPEQARIRGEEMKRFGKEIRRLTGGKDPDIVFEHVGRDTFPTSVFVAKRFGKVVICGATSGFNLDFDVRHLWMRQKSIIGSHFCNAYQAERANDLIASGRIHPVLDKAFPFEQGPLAHQLMAENRHKAKMAIAVQVPAEEVGRARP